MPSVPTMGTMSQRYRLTSNPSGSAISDTIMSAVAVSRMCCPSKSRTISGLSMMYFIGLLSEDRAVNLVERQRADGRLAIHHRQSGRIATQEERERVAQVVMPPDGWLIGAGSAGRQCPH